MTRREQNNNNNNNNNNERKRPPPPRPLQLQESNDTGADAAFAATGRKRGKIAEVMMDLLSSSKWDWTPLPILALILNWLDPISLKEACTVSKEFRDVISNQKYGMDNELISVIEISPSENEKDYGRPDRLFQKLNQRSQQLQQFRKIKVYDVQKFDIDLHEEYRYDQDHVWIPGYGGVSRVVQNLRLNGIVSLDISLPTPAKRHSSLPTLLASVLINLRDLNLSNTRTNYNELRYITTKCRHLQTITWNGINHNNLYSIITIDGCSMYPAKNLKEIFMDDSVFTFFRANEEDVPMDIRSEICDLDDEDNSGIYIFHECGSSNILERVSIKNARYGSVRHHSDIPTITAIPQNALIKFVRNAPQTMRWFRSDLSQENIDMLRKERPKIEFLN